MLGNFQKPSKHQHGGKVRCVEDLFKPRVQLQLTGFNKTGDHVAEEFLRRKRGHINLWGCLLHGVVDRIEFSVSLSNGPSLSGAGYLNGIFGVVPHLKVSGNGRNDCKGLHALVLFKPLVYNSVVQEDE